MSNRLRKNTSIRDVAEKAGVNPSTVSRILSNSLDMRAKKETIARVKRIASELNYHPNSSARSLRTRKTFSLNMYVPTISSPVFPEIINGAEDACRQQGYSLFVSHLDERSVKERRYLESLNNGQVDGLLMATTLVEDSVIDDLIEQESSFILINRRTDSSAKYFAVDDVMGARVAVDHLVELGHKHIGCLSGPLMIETSLRRFQGYRQGLHDHGLDYDASLVEETNWFSYKSGQESMARLLARSNNITAVFVTNLMTCVGAISAIHQAGLKIPEDISIVGYHDAPLAEVQIPPLTVVKMPLYEMGYQGANVLIKMLQGEIVEEQQLLPPQGIVERSSTAMIK